MLNRTRIHVQKSFFCVLFLFCLQNHKITKESEKCNLMEACTNSAIWRQKFHDSPYWSVPGQHSSAKRSSPSYVYNTPATQSNIQRVNREIFFFSKSILCTSSSSSSFRLVDFLVPLFGCKFNWISKYPFHVNYCEADAFDMALHTYIPTTLCTQASYK